MCKNCVLDDSVNGITFDECGVCNYCNTYFENEKRTKKSNGAKELNDLVQDIKNSGKGKGYDCLIGLSGGIDSSYLAYFAVRKLGLRPLAVHFDNGWNSELAVDNVNRIIDKLDLQLFTFVMNWEEFKDLQLSYMKASVVDLEVPTDHFIFATMYKYAHENGIKYILNGWNYMTESIMPIGWNSSKDDLGNLLHIHETYGTRKLTNYPKFGIRQRLFYSHIAKIKQVFPLNYIEYNISDVKDTLSSELGWKDYEGKHFESIWTRFYQGYILPVKFNIDKRLAHLSNLICSNQISKEQALAMLSQDTYLKEKSKEDMEYVLSKLDLTPEDFNHLMALPTKAHDEFRSDKENYEKWSRIVSLAEPILYYLLRPISLLRYIKYRIYLKFHPS
jgi:N-acetyl sugar amidotransferase